MPCGDIMRIVHITINTADLEKSLAFYQDIMEMKIQRDMRQLGRPIVFLTDSADGTCVELIENPEQPYNGAGLSIGFHVDDVESAHKLMMEKGLKPTPMTSPNPGTKFFFVNDPNGVRIQFI